MANCLLPCTPPAKRGAQSEPMLTNDRVVPAGFVEVPFAFAVVPVVSFETSEPAQLHTSFGVICAARRIAPIVIQEDTDDADAVFGDFSDDEASPLKDNPEGSVC